MRRPFGSTIEGVSLVMTDENETWRTSPLYTIPEAARLAGVSTPTVRRWLWGYDTGTSQMPPVFGTVDQKTDEPSLALVSFLQLAEIVVASSFRKHGIKLDVIRAAHAKAKAGMYPIEYPFATLELEPLGGHILRRFDLEHGTRFTDPPPKTSFEALDTPGLFTLPDIVTQTLSTFDYERKLAARWYPLGNTTPIVIDPRYSAGVPTIPERRVTASAVVKRFKAGQSIRFIARDLLLTMAQVEAVIRYGDKVAA